MNNKIQIEQNTINRYRELLLKLVKSYAKNNRAEIDAFDERRLNQFINRAANMELDFLHDEPDEFFEMYCKDQELN